MEDKIFEIATRISGLREDLEITPEEMAKIHEIDLEEYLNYETGIRDFSFTFLYNTANRFGVDISDLITGSSPTLSMYTHVKKGHGLKMQRRKGFQYQNLAHLFKHRNAEPFLVEVPYDSESDTSDITLRSHAGQEFDYVIKGALRMRIDQHEIIVNEGDSVYYDASHGHGMVATKGESCTFLAVVIKDSEGRIG